MLPPGAPNYLGYCGLGNAVLVGYRLLTDAASAKLPDLHDLLIYQARLGVIFSESWNGYGSALCHHISHVVLMGSKKQMLGIYTRGVIAAMKHPQAICDEVIVQLVRKTMGGNTLAVDVEGAIAFVRLCASPKPAIVRLALDNFLPESIFRGAIDGFHFAAMTRQKAYGKALDLMAPAVRALCNRRWLTATAHAQAARVGIWKMLVGRVTAKIVKGFTLVVTVATICCFCQIRFLAATAMAVTVWDFVRGIMGLHENLHFSCQARGTREVSPGTLHWSALVQL